MMHIQPGKYGERGNRLGQFLGYVTVNNSEDFFEQDGIWELHLCTFRLMLPYFHYDQWGWAFAHAWALPWQNRVIMIKCSRVGLIGIIRNNK